MIKRKSAAYFYFGIIALLASFSTVSAAVAIPEKTSVDFCIDSDSGIEYYKKGIVDVNTASISNGRYYDICSVGEDELHEWYCKEMQPTEIIKDCPNGCQDGACLYERIEKPDLAVDSIRIVPENPGVNDEVCLYADIKNIGRKDISSSDITVWTYVNNSHISNTFYGRVLGMGEHMEKEVLCSKYGENVVFRKGPNSVWVVIDPDTVNIIDESDELNNGMNTSFDISESGGGIADIEDWDISINFDVANKESFYPFSPSPGTLGEKYYVKLNSDDNVYRETVYANTCPSYWDSDPSAKRALGWYAERKRMDNGDFKILIRGTAPADCNYSSPGESKGELSVNPASGWKIKEIVKCNAQGSNKGQDVGCEAGASYITFSAGSTCGGCCACADSGSLDIEVILEKEGGSPEIMPKKQCTDSDGGQNIFEKGKTTYMGYTNTDNCTVKNKLVEYYCSDDGAGLAVDRECANGCKDGACLKDADNFSDAVTDINSMDSPVENFLNSGIGYFLVAILGLVLGIVAIAVVALSKKT